MPPEQNTNDIRFDMFAEFFKELKSELKEIKISVDKVLLLEERFQNHSRGLGRAFDQLKEEKERRIALNVRVHELENFKAATNEKMIDVKDDIDEIKEWAKKAIGRVMVLLLSTVLSGAGALFLWHLTNG